MIKDISLKYLFLSEFVTVSWYCEIILHANTSLELQLFCSNVLFADFKLQNISITISERTTCRMICEMGVSGDDFFAAVILKKYIEPQGLGWPIQINSNQHSTAF